MDRITALLDDALTAGLGSAAAVSIGDGGQEIIQLVRGHTRRAPTSGPPLDAGAWFDLASLTKPMATVACAMVLAGDGRLDLDAPVQRWLAASTTGTVQHLLGHAAGCAPHVEFFRTLAVGTHADPRAELLALAAVVPATAPGVMAVYSDLGYLMLGAIVERAAGLPLEDAFAELVAGPLELGARYAVTALPGAVATEIDAPGQGGHADAPARRGLVEGLVHDENAWFGGRVCGHAGLFATIGDVGRFGAAIGDVLAGHARGRLRPEVVRRFVTEAAAPGASWRLGWDTPSTTPGISHAGDRWPRAHAIGHLGFTGTSLWLDPPNRRWVALLTNRVHPSRHGTADAIKALRRAVNDAAIDLLA